MKKILVTLLVCALTAMTAVSFTACKNKDDGDFKIGVLHINPVNSTSGYTYAHQKGILAAAESLGIDKKNFMYKDSLDDGDTTAINTAIEDLINNGAKMIIGTSFGYQDAMLAAAEVHKDVIFSHGTGYLNNLDGTGNMNNYFGRIYQARYLSGIVAGLKAKSIENPKLGYVSAFGTEVAETASGINAFALGAQSVYPEATVSVKVLSSWYDPTNEGAYADALITAGCGIITQHCDTENPSQKASDKNAFSIGYNSDMGLAIGTGGNRNASVLTSVLWNWGAYYTKAIAEAKKCFDDKGKFKNTDAWKAFGNYYGDINDNLYELAPLSSAAAANTDKYVAAATAKLKDGTFDVFKNQKLTFTLSESTVTAAVTAETLKKADNTDAGTVTDAMIQGSMNFYVKGVTQS